MNNSVITILSGLGTCDTSVSIAKAIFMEHAPGAVIVDITHSVAQYDLQQAAYLLLSAYRHFPQGAIHVLPIDVFAGNAPRMLLAEKDNYFFIAPDNGVLPLAFGAALTNTRLCYEFSKSFSFTDWLQHAARVIEAVIAGNASSFKRHAVDIIPRLLQPKVMHDGIDCNVLFIDRYENVVLDITSVQFDELVKGRPFRIKLMRMSDITAVSNNYNDVPQGKPLCRFNNAGFLEIALNHAKAATLLGLDAGNTSNLRYRTIKIFLPHISAPAFTQVMKPL